MDNIRIMYLRDNKIQTNLLGIGRGNPIGCIAIKLDKERSIVNYAVSALNPVDKFDRKLGRQLTKGRLLEKPSQIIISSDEISMHSITRKVMIHISINRNLPNPIRKAALAWLKGNN